MDRRWMCGVAAGLLAGLPTLGGTAAGAGALYDMNALLRQPNPLAGPGGIYAPSYQPATPTPAGAIPGYPSLQTPTLPGAGQQRAPVRVAPPPPTLRYTPPPAPRPRGRPQAQTTPRTTAQAQRAGASAMADDDAMFGGWFERFYIALGGGYDLPDDYGGTAGGAAFEVDLDAGFVVDAAIGTYLWDAWRAEFQVSYRAADSEAVTVGGATVAGASAELTSLATMINAYFDLRFDFPLVPYFGVGLGAVFLDGDQVTIAGAKGEAKDTTEFAYQGIVGIAWEISRDWALVGEYRYFGSGDSDVTSHTGAANIRYSF